MTTLTLGAVEPIGATKKDGRAREEHVRARPAVLDVQPRARAQRVFIREKFARKPEVAEANVLALRAGGPTARPPRRSAAPTRCHRPSCSPATYRQITGNTALAYGLVTAGQLGQHCRCSSAPTRSPRHRTSCTSCPSTRTSTSRPSRPRTRSPASARRWAPPTAARSASPPRRGPGVALKAEAIGLAVMTGAAAGRRRRPARRALHRPAHQDRAGRPDAGAVRPQRRIAGRGDRAALAVGLLRGRRRGRAHRVHLPHAGHPAVRRYIANGSEPWRIPDVTDATHRSTTPSANGRRELPAVPARPGDAGPASAPCQAPPVWNTASVGWRRPNGRATSPTNRRTTTSWSGCGQAKIDGIAVPDLEVDDPTGDAELLLIGLGRHLRADR